MTILNVGSNSTSGGPICLKNMHIQVTVLATCTCKGIDLSNYSHRSCKGDYTF